jgi:hypothetical protein
MPPALNFLNYALRVFIITLMLPVAAVTVTAAVVFYFLAADGSILRGLLAAVCGLGVWGFVGTLAAAQIAVAMGASRIIEHVSVGKRIRQLLPHVDDLDQPPPDMTIDEFRTILRDNKSETVTRPEDSRPASIVGAWLLRRMQGLAVWAIERVVRVRFTERKSAKIVISRQRLADAVATGLDLRVAVYVRRKATLVTAGLCLAGLGVSAVLTYGIRLLPI